MLPVIAEIVRSGFVEGHHHGAVVAIDADGGVAYERGETRTPILPRSCNKPLQAVAMLRLGLDLDGALLALACGSHSGEEFHVAAARQILADAGIDESALRTPPDWPLDDEVRNELVRAGGTRTPVHMNCSGKHAAMLATCVANDWPLDSYVDPGHPLQQAIASTFSELTGEPVAHVAVDGCGAPLLATSLVGLARAFATLATSDRPEEQRVATAIRNHPEYVSGSNRDERALLRAVPGAIAKAGAEACYAVALADGRAFAVKTDDGAPRARPVVMAGLLRHLGVDVEPGVDTDGVRNTGWAPLLGGGAVVGEIRAVL